MSPWGKVRVHSAFACWSPNLSQSGHEGAIGGFGNEQLIQQSPICHIFYNSSSWMCQSLKSRVYVCMSYKQSFIQMSYSSARLVHCQFKEGRLMIAVLQSLDLWALEFGSRTSSADLNLLKRMTSETDVQTILMFELWSCGKSLQILSSNPSTVVDLSTIILHHFLGQTSLCG